MYTKGTPEERFMNHVDIEGPKVDGIHSNCWVWLGGSVDAVNPSFNMGEDRIVGVARSSWELFVKKSIPNNKCVARRCSTFRCVNPNHLYLGSKGDARVAYIIQDSGVRTKPCSVCGERFIFTNEYFNKHSSTDTGLGSRCKTCAVNVTLESSVKHWSRLMLYRCKESAEHKGLVLSITEQDILDIFDSQEGKCFWSGIQMLPSKIHRYPFKPSPDRLDNSLGYTKDNVVLCCVFMNVGRNSCDLDTFISAIRKYPEIFGRGLWKKRFD